MERKHLALRKVAPLALAITIAGWAVVNPVLAILDAAKRELRRPVARLAHGRLLAAVAVRLLIGRRRSLRCVVFADRLCAKLFLQERDPIGRALRDLLQNCRLRGADLGEFAHEVGKVHVVLVGSVTLHVVQGSVPRLERRLDANATQLISSIRYEGLYSPE